MLCLSHSTSIPTPSAKFSNCPPSLFPSVLFFLLRDRQKVLGTCCCASHTGNKFVCQACTSQIKRVLFGNDLWEWCRWCTWQWGAELLMMVLQYQVGWGGERGGERNVGFVLQEDWSVGSRRMPVVAHTCAINHAEASGPRAHVSRPGPWCTSSTFSPQARSACCLETATKSSVWSRPLWAFGSPLLIPQDREAHYS